jgi:glycine dehydrogenase subunit 1
MPFIPHTEAEIESMLKTIGVRSIDELFDEIPKDLFIDDLPNIPEGISEMAVSRLMKERAQQNKTNALCFIGAGAYEHHIPAPVWHIAARGEFMTAYTPYQAEASQGTLQLLYEYQTMMARLTGMDASNASLYDGGSGLGEAILMAIRANRKSKSKKILLPKTIHPLYREAALSMVKNQDVHLIEIPYDEKTGVTDLNALSQYENEDIAAIVIPQPNFFGCLENVDELTNWAHAHHAIVIAVVNPISLALLKEPGKWGEKGVDIVCGEGQPLGAPLSGGGPYFGFLTCKQEHIRQMPGRIIGSTTDTEGNIGYVLTLQAREQHIRRSKATSNICSNQGLMVTAATIFMSILGPKGLEQVAKTCHNNTKILVEKLSAINGVKIMFNRPYFHEVVLSLPKSAKTILDKMAEQNILAGFDLSEHYPELENVLLVCCTETKTEEDIETYVNALKKAVL